MRTLTDRATKILWEILSLQTPKIDSSDSVFMPLYVKIVETTQDWRVISLAHYGEQNGDLMRDPEMLFLHDVNTGNFIPYYYRNDYIGIETQSLSFEDGKVFEKNLSAQADQTNFANLWLYNIAKQQKLNK